MKKQYAVGLILSLSIFCACPGEGAPWRSQLYPEDWTPQFEDAKGRFLPDFSYAGYRNGEAPLPDGAGAQVFDVVADFGADNTGAADATQAIQAAIDAAKGAGGGVALLPEGIYRCDGLLRVGGANTILRGTGPEKTRVFFTRVEGMSGKGHITFAGAVKREGEWPLVVDGENRALMVVVEGSDRSVGSDGSDKADGEDRPGGEAQERGLAKAGLLVGDEVALGWVITDEFVAEHGMTGTWQAFNGKWQAVFRRTVMALNEAASGLEVTLDVPLRYPAKVRDAASLRLESGYLSECGLEDLSVSNAVDWDAAWEEVRVHAITLRGVKDCWVRNVRSFASPLEEADGYHLQNGGIKVLDSKRVTIADCRMEKAQNRGGGGCGYLFEVSQCNEILTRDCTAIAGRHNFIQNWGFGTTGCVWLRCSSAGSRNVIGSWDPIGLPAFCEYHHSLAMACLVDQCSLADGWYGGNRNDWSSGAGQTVTQSVYWNTSGGGIIRSWQYGMGYIIGTHDLNVKTSLWGDSAKGTAPEDYIEGRDKGTTLVPQSLYEDQLDRRLGVAVVRNSSATRDEAAD